MATPGARPLTYPMTTGRACDPLRSKFYDPILHKERGLIEGEVLDAVQGREFDRDKADFHLLREKGLNRLICVFLGLQILGMSDNGFAFAPERFNGGDFIGPIGLKLGNEFGFVGLGGLDYTAKGGVVLQ